MSDEESSRTRGARRPRSLLKSAAISATGAMLVACGSSVGAAPDPVPLPGNPKGSHFDDNASEEILVSGTIEIVGIEAAELEKVESVFVSIRGESGPPLAARKLAAGPFPMEFELTAADIVSMGGGDRPVPESFRIKVALDTDGNPMSNDGLGEYVSTVKKGRTGLAVQISTPRIPKEVRPPGNPKGSMYDEELKKDVADPKMDE